MGPVIVTGAGGLLGRFVARALEARGVRVEACGRSQLDVTDANAVRACVLGLRPSAVVHCAAMTDVDACERDPGAATLVNAQASANVAAATAEVGAEVVAISTDYVFDGTKGSAYVETDRPNPVQRYGASKLEGERSVAEANPRHYIVRSAWIYGPGGKNHFSRNVPLRGAVSAVIDQTGSPTYAPDLAGAIASLLGSGAYGILHVVNEGACTAADLFRNAGCDVTEISWTSLGRPAARPANTSLDGEAWRKAGFAPLRPWQDAVADFAVTG